MQPTQTRSRPLSTTTSEVRESYYGLPVMKAPHWRWLIIVYFFLGALAGGSFTIATLADLFSKDRALVRAGHYLSLVTAGISPVLLALDLGRPDRAHHMFRIVKLKSPMSLGSWALLTLGMMAGPVSFLEFVAHVTGRDLFRRTRRVLSVLGLPASIFVAGYTGVLLAATNVPLWARNYLLLGPTFIASAFSNSLAALSLLLRLTGSGRPETETALARAETLSLATELGLVVAGLVRLGNQREPLTGGRWGRIFWPVTLGGGMLLPLGLQLSARGRGPGSAGGRRSLAAVLTLVGGFTLRMLMVLAGKDSARDPKYYLAYTRGTNGTRGAGRPDGREGGR